MSDPPGGLKTIVIGKWEEEVGLCWEWMILGGKTGPPKNGGRRQVVPQPLWCGVHFQAPLLGKSPTHTSPTDETPGRGLNSTWVPLGGLFFRQRKPLPAFAVSPVLSVQNNQYTKVAWFGVVCPELLIIFWGGLFCHPSPWTLFFEGLIKYKAVSKRLIWWSLWGLGAGIRHLPSKRNLLVGRGLYEAAWKDREVWGGAGGLPPSLCVLKWLV